MRLLRHMSRLLVVTETPQYQLFQGFQCQKILERDILTRTMEALLFILWPQNIRKKEQNLLLRPSLRK